MTDEEDNFRLADNPRSRDSGVVLTGSLLNILQNGKAIATVQGQWVKLPPKAQYSTVVSDGDKIAQVQFSGSDQAFQP